MDKPIQPTRSGLPYKFLAALLFVISVIHISSAQVPSDGVNVDVVVSQPGLWPKEVTLATVVPVSLVIDGKTVGTANLPVGMKLPLVKVTREKVQLNYNGTLLMVAHSDTDLFSRIAQSLKQQETLARARAASVPVVVVPPPKPVATPVLGAIAKDVKGDLVQLDGKSIAPFNDSSLAKVKYFAVYFSANWCPPCRAFTPKLVSFYNNLKPQHPEFELLFVSRDRSETDAQNYMEKDLMRWPALRFSKIQGATTLNKLAGPGIPCLVFIDQDGDILSNSYEGKTYVGPQKVMRDIETTLTGPRADKKN